MSWNNQRLLFNLENAPNRSNHAQVPTPYVMKDRIRIYFAGRRNGQSFPTFVDVGHDLKKILRVHGHPIMESGLPGMFDSDGVMPSCVIEHPHSGELLMYYIGWNARSSGARYQNEIGLAVSNDGGKTFERKFPGPIMGRTPTEPGLAVMPFVMHKSVFHMWYQSGVSWNRIEEQYEPVYVIKHAKSLDGIVWSRSPEICAEQSGSLEAHSRPAVMYSDGIWKMWFCYRGSAHYRGGKGSYRIGYAESSDGINFKRRDAVFKASGEWDSEMQCYPYVFELNGKILMLYNGNGFGQTGIGIAEWQ